MRKRRCFADTELDAVTLEHERAQALLSRRAAVPQQPVPFPVPVTSYQLPPPELAQSDDTAMRLIGLVRSWGTLPGGVSEAGVRTASSGYWPLDVGLLSKSGVDNVVGTFSAAPQPPEVCSISLQHAGSPSTLAGLPTLPPIFRASTAARDRQDRLSSQIDAATGRCRVPMTRRLKDSDNERRHVESKSLRRTFDFSVEALLAK